MSSRRSREQRERDQRAFDEALANLDRHGMPPLPGADEGRERKAKGAGRTSRSSKRSLPTLDLHGCVRKESASRLRAFLDSADGGARLRVVHGKGTGALEATVAPEHVRDTAYFMKYLDGKPAFEWQFALVVMLAAGAWLAARLGGTRQAGGVPELWAARFGPSRLKRYAGAFLGGAVLLFGARLAGGCTSGHGISGGLQLAVSSWTFVAAMLASGILTARVLFHRQEA